ncbi:TIGR02530 family flagellar biosynthesis protein [Evansella sp. AB-rgal1]|uniref:TIGR02530 family flagellar biosynthesis protein n=1 Tax=Evansella sp. AB-rgal1 TaxID=3242696 RepID=UPI00359CBCB9
MSNQISPYHLQKPFIKTLPKKQTLHSPMTNGTFQAILDGSMKGNELKLSKHAEKRLHDRGITISPEVWNKINVKVIEAQKKGVDDSLVLTNNAALVVNAKNKTVITAMDRNEAQAQLFTNISGAILID